jgi:hypothetical protein
MYAQGNPKTKKQLRQWIESGLRIDAYSAAGLDRITDGPAVIEGPQGVPHRWYAQVQLKGGRIIKVLK